MEMEDAVKWLTTGLNLGKRLVGRATRCFFSDFQKNLNNLPLQARAVPNQLPQRSWMRRLRAMAASSWSKMMVPDGQDQGPQLRAMSLFSSADGAMGSSVTSASTRLVADEGEMGLDLMDIPKGLINKMMDIPKGLTNKRTKRVQT